MKSFLGALGAIFLVLIVAVAGFIGYAVVVGGKLDASSKAYVDENVPVIVSHWDIDEFKKRESPQFRSVCSDEQLATLFQKFSVLGPMQKYEDSKGDSNINVDQNGRHVTASYTATATFQNGKAEIAISLIQIGGDWQILGFRVNSDVFLK